MRFMPGILPAVLLTALASAIDSGPVTTAATLLRHDLAAEDNPTTERIRVSSSRSTDA